MRKKLLIICPILLLVVMACKSFDSKKRGADTAGTKEKIVNLKKDDEMIQKFKDTAQQELPYLIEFMSKHNPKDTLYEYLVKTPFAEKGESEHMWVQVTSFKNGYFSGQLSNEPAFVTNVKLGDKVKVAKEDVEDWILRDYETGTEVGAFSRAYIESQSH